MNEIGQITNIENVYLILNHLFTNEQFSMNFKSRLIDK